ncbi:LarC family nickel insertion protein [Gracilibacillus oryzae]|uniref:LarC family nickel insertion protein n=1 Tax=Gracilibacillus oryzae TaxID=1672701 RepID=A0A7C8GTN6_9BACI|nr:LarC family nickel insertion protein [Gracilibacillus oryzae]KAB8137604.1 LarC family nickel insertion protein [Gracilibacillus oryzae]
MEKRLYLDCFSGISGDMTIAALMDTAGIQLEFLEGELSKLHLEDEYQLKLSRVNKNGISSLKFDVIYGEHHHEDGHHHEHGHHHHHDEEHTHGHGHTHHHHDHEHTHTHDHHDHKQTHDHSHGHHHNHTHDHGHHHHRTYKDIVALIESSDLDQSVKELALKIFKVIGEAEAKIHGMDLETVHFHEVGAIDSIVDIVGTAILVDKLAINKVISSPVPVGSGRIKIDHGLYPVPAPATLEILKDVPLKSTNIKGELTTPTGAAIVKVLAEEFSDSIPDMTVKQIGYGAGTKTFKDNPNVLRIILG